MRHKLLDLRHLGPMTTQEAEAFNVEESKRAWFIRVDSAKANMRKPQEGTEWCERVSTELENNDLGPGDQVGTLRRWEPPDAFEGLSVFKVRQILDKITKGMDPDTFYGSRPQTPTTWVGQVLMGEPYNKSKSAASQILKAWFASGLLYIKDIENDDHKVRKSVRVALSKAPGAI